LKQQREHRRYYTTWSNKLAWIIYIEDESMVSFKLRFTKINKQRTSYEDTTACVNCYHHQRGIPKKIHHQEQHGPWLKVFPWWSWYSVDLYPWLCWLTNDHISKYTDKTTTCVLWHYRIYLWMICYLNEEFN
jgi:hypothetical protein